MTKAIRRIALAAGLAGAVSTQQTLAGDAPMPTETPAKNKQMVRHLYEECINPGRLERLEEFFGSDFVGAGGEKGASAFRSAVEPLLAAFPDIHFTVEDLIAEGDRVVVRWKWAGTHRAAFRGLPPSQKQVTNTGIAVYQFRDHKIVQTWLETDRLGLLRQVGAVPANLGAGGPPKGR